MPKTLLRSQIRATDGCHCVSSSRTAARGGRPAASGERLEYFMCICALSSDWFYVCPKGRLITDNSPCFSARQTRLKSVFFSWSASAQGSPLLSVLSPALRLCLIEPPLEPVHRATALIFRLALLLRHSPSSAGLFRLLRIAQIYYAQKFISCAGSRWPARSLATFFNRAGQPESAEFYYLLRHAAEAPEALGQTR